jgi:hypothetical protein
MKERLACLLSEIGESFDYLKSDIRNLSRYMAELEDLLERYRAFVSTATLTMPADQAELRKLLKKTQKVIGPPPEDVPSQDGQEAESPVRTSLNPFLVKSGDQ